MEAHQEARAAQKKARHRVKEKVQQRPYAFCVETLCTFSQQHVLMERWWVLCRPSGEAQLTNPQEVPRI
jgi:hypothetical protein